MSTEKNKDKDYIKELNKIKSMKEKNSAGAETIKKKKEMIEKVMRDADRSEEEIEEVKDQMNKSRNI